VSIAIIPTFLLHRRYDPRQEPDAAIPHVRIRAGGRPRGRFLPRHGIVIPGKLATASATRNPDVRGGFKPAPTGYRLEFILSKPKGRYDGKERNK
jgi:hypothetical protein